MSKTELEYKSKCKMHYGKMFLILMKAVKSRIKKVTPSTNKQFSSFQKEVEELKQLGKLSRTLPETDREGKSINLNNYYSL